MPRHAAEPFRPRVTPVLVPLPTASVPDETQMPETQTLLVDCDTCAVAGAACRDCVVSVLLGQPDDGFPGLRAGPDERRALRALADAGLVPALRHVPAVGA